MTDPEQCLASTLHPTAKLLAVPLDVLVDRDLHELGLLKPGPSTPRTEPSPSSIPHLLGRR